MFSLQRIIFWLSALLGVALMWWSASDAFALLSGDRIEASVCSINHYWNCDRASLSAWGSWFSLPVGVFGAAWFLGALLLHLSASFFFRFWLILGLGTAIVMFSYLIVVVKAGCIVCYATYALMALLVTTGWSSARRVLSGRVALIAGAFFGALFLGFIYFQTQKVATRFADEEVNRWYDQSVSVPLVSPLRKGAENPKLTVVEFSDFGCPFCAKATEVLLPFLLDQKDTALVFYPFPLDSSCNPSVTRMVHPYSCEWSKAVLCADKEGKAWALHDALFDRVKKGLPLVALSEWFPEVGLDRGALEICMQSPETKELLSTLIRVGSELHVESTPTFFLNGRRFPGVVPMPLVQKVLAKVRSL